MEGAPKQEDIREKLIQEIDDLRLELNELMDKMSEMPVLPTTVSEQNMKVIEKSREVSRKLYEKSNEYEQYVRNNFLKS